MPVRFWNSSFIPFMALSGGIGYLAFRASRSKAVKQVEEQAQEIAKAAPPAPVAGQDYELIEGGAAFEPVADKIEVVEVFGYTCPHCAAFEPALSAWKARQPKDVRVLPLAAPFGGHWTPYARAYFTARRLGVDNLTHTAVFQAVHRQRSLPGNPTAEELAAFYVERAGVDRDRFLAVFNGSDVDADLERAKEFIIRSGVQGTPTLVVNGKYRVLSRVNSAHPLQTVERLVALERASRRAAPAKR